MHQGAFGLSLPLKNLEAFTSYINQTLASVNFGEGIYNIDFRFQDSNLNELYSTIMKIGQCSQLWGKGVEEPLFYLKNLTIDPSECSICGEKRNTIRIQKNGVTFIKFKESKMVEEIENRQNIEEKFCLSIVGRASINNYNGGSYPQIIITDYEIKDLSLFEF